MNDEEAAKASRASREWMDNHRELYLRSGGTQGHIMDLSPLGGHRFTTNCLIRHKGRKSGRTLINPLVYGDIGGEVIIVGSKGGKPQHPGWYYNIMASATIDLQIATQAFRARWREAEGDERKRLWAFMVEILPNYELYQKITGRRIPVIVMTPQEEIPVFTLADLD